MSARTEHGQWREELAGARLDPSQGRWIPARPDWRTRLAAALGGLFRR